MRIYIGVAPVYVASVAPHEAVMLLSRNIWNGIPFVGPSVHLTSESNFREPHPATFVCPCIGLGLTQNAASRERSM